MYTKTSIICYYKKKKYAFTFMFVKYINNYRKAVKDGAKLTRIHRTRLFSFTYTY